MINLISNECWINCLLDQSQLIKIPVKAQKNRQLLTETASVPWNVQCSIFLWNTHGKEMVHMTKLAGTSAMQKCLCYYYNPCELVTNSP